MRILFPPALLLFLSGCAALAIPPALTIASYAGDGVSYLATDKTITDHMLSDAVGRNCAVWRLFRGESICKDYTPAEAEARAKARREIRYDDERAQVAQIDGPYSLPDPSEGTAIAQAPKKSANPSSGGGKPAVTAEELAAIAPAAGGAGIKPRTGAMRNPPAKTSRPAAVKHLDRRPAKSSRRVRSTPVKLDRFIVFGSFRSKRAAARLARRHQILDPFVVPARVRGTTYYRVVTRPEGRSNIAIALGKLKRAGVGDAYAIRACRVGRVNARCLRQVPRRNAVTSKSFDELLAPRRSVRPGPATTATGG